MRRSWKSWGEAAATAARGACRTLEARPLALAAFAFTTGCAVAQASFWRPLPWPLLLLGSGATLAVFGALRSNGGFPRLALTLLLLGFASAGAGTACLRSRVEEVPSLETEVLVEGTIATPPIERNGRLGFLLEVDTLVRDGAPHPASFALRVGSLPDRTLARGERVRLRAKLAPILPPANPGASDPRRRCASGGVVAYASVVEGQLARLGSDSLRAHVERFFERRRAEFRDLLERAIPETEPRALVAALAIGERADLSEETNDAFSISGLAHILSVSGLHVAVVAAGVYRTLRLLLKRSRWLLLHADPARVAALLALGPIAYYVLLTGAGPPAVRSGLMAALLLLAPVFRREADALTSLGLALQAALLVDPAMLQELSFQLSFAAVGGLILLSAPLRRLIPVRPPRGGGPLGRRALLALRETIFGTACATLAASVATAPLIASTFHRASYVALLANLISFPIASLLTILSAAGALLAPLSKTLAFAPLWGAGPVARLLLDVGRLFAALPFASAIVAAFPLLALLGWYGLCAAFSAARPLQRAMGVLAFVSALLFLGSLSSRELGPRIDRELVVTFFAIGQGDAALVQFPYGGAILIDTGGAIPPSTFDPGARILLPALAELQATHLDALVISHPHPDHIGGAAALLKNLSIGSIWHAPQARKGGLFEPLSTLARDKGIPLRAVSRGERLETPGGALIEILSPTAEAPLTENDASLVLRITYGKASFLFTGDIEAAGEAHLEERGELHATVLKIPHHGSNTSSSPGFIAAVRPREAVFSVGRNNQFHFPRPEVGARYAASGIRTWRTDQAGAIRFATDGVRLSIHPTLAPTGVASDPPDSEVRPHEPSRTRSGRAVEEPSERPAGRRPDGLPPGEVDDPGSAPAPSRLLGAGGGRAGGDPRAARLPPVPLGDRRSLDRAAPLGGRPGRRDLSPTA